MAWYDTGTVNVTANSATVTGVGTQWLAGARRGEAFVAPDGRLYEVLNIASNTSLTLTKPYRGTSATGQQYALAPMQGYVKELADRAAQLLNEYGLATDAEAVARTSKTKALTPYGLGLNLQSSVQDATAGKILTVGAFGLGAGTATPPNGRNTVNPFGWYYSNQAVTWGGGQFFLDMPFGGDMNAGLRLSTDPYTDNFYLNGGIFGKKEYLPACKIWHDRNTTVDSNGFIKRASPIVELAADGFKKTDHLEIKGVRFERVGTGHYMLHDAPLLSRDGWYIETPKDRNNNIYFTLDYEEDEQSKTLTIRTYEPDYSTGRATNGEPMDILEGRFVSLRFAEDPGLYPVYVPDSEPAPEPEPDLEPEVEPDLEPLPDPPEPIEEPAA